MKEEIIKLLSQTFIPVALISKAFHSLLTAREKQYAKDRGMDADSPEAILGYAKKAVRNGFLVLLVSESLFALFMAIDDNREAYGAWLDKAEPLITSLAEFSVLILYFAIFITVSAAVAYLALRLAKAEQKTINRGKKLLSAVFFWGSVAIAFAVFTLIAHCSITKGVSLVMWTIKELLPALYCSAPLLIAFGGMVYMSFLTMECVMDTPQLALDIVSAIKSKKRKQRNNGKKGKK